ncbi:MAG: hypothetical protein KDA95_04365, partial [Acidimicrobiales bacterium]|nr:hypothetical protein [Acidimicrobiales bacterium]
MLMELIEQWDEDLRSLDPLGFPGYREVLDGLDHESVRTGLAEGAVLIEGDFDVIGGSMGLVHGEKVVRALDRATEMRLPVVMVTRSGGARMQEGMVSLIQLSRTAAAINRHRQAGLLSIVVHRSPTTGGVFASYGSLADIRIAEAGALVGFAGPRVVQAVTGASVEGASHSAETAYSHGLVDAVVEPDDVLGWVRTALGFEDRPLHAPRAPLPIKPAEPIKPADSTGPDPSWAAVRSARQLGRPSGVQLAAAVTTSWSELGAGADPTIRVALATAGGQRVMVIAMDRYVDHGQPTSRAYGLACRAIWLADQLRIPILTFVDTPGARVDPAEENAGIARAIARTHMAMASVTVPTVSLCVGEGGSGGAQALSAADRLLIQQGAIFSVIGPEGAAAILERDAAKAEQVAPLLKLTAEDLVGFGIADELVSDEVPAAAQAVLTALKTAKVGDRTARLNAATARWLQGDATNG